MGLYQISPEQIASFEIEEGFESSVSTAAVGLFHGRVPEVLHAIYQNAMNPKMPNQHLWMEALLLIVKPNLLSGDPFAGFPAGGAPAPPKKK